MTIPPSVLALLTEDERNQLARSDAAARNMLGRSRGVLGGQLHRDLDAVFGADSQLRENAAMRTALGRAGPGEGPNGPLAGPPRISPVTLGAARDALSAGSALKAERLQDRVEIQNDLDARALPVRVLDALEFSFRRSEGHLRRVRGNAAARERDSLLALANKVETDPGAPQQIPNYFTYLYQLTGEHQPLAANAVEVDGERGANIPKAELVRRLRAHADKQSGRVARLDEDTAAANRRLAAVPVSPVVGQLTEPGLSMGESLARANQQPVEAIAQLALQNADQIGLTVAGGLAGRALRMSPALSAGAASVPSTVLAETQGTLVEAGGKAGLDQSTAEGVAALRGPQFDEARRRGRIRAGVVSAGNVLGLGLAGRTLAPAGLAVGRSAVNIAAQLPLQAGIEAGTEALAQRLSGQQFDGGQVVAEALGGLGTAPIDVFAATAGTLREARARPTNPSLAGTADAPVGAAFETARGAAVQFSARTNGAVVVVQSAPGQYDFKTADAVTEQDSVVARITPTVARSELGRPEPQVADTADGQVNPLDVAFGQEEIGQATTTAQQVLGDDVVPELQVRLARATAQSTGQPAYVYRGEDGAFAVYDRPPTGNVPYLDVNATGQRPVVPNVGPTPEDVGTQRINQIDPSEVSTTLLAEAQEDADFTGQAQYIIRTPAGTLEVSELAPPAGQEQLVVEPNVSTEGEAVNAPGAPALARTRDPEASLTPVRPDIRQLAQEEADASGAPVFIITDVDGTQRVSKQLSATRPSERITPLAEQDGVLPREGTQEQRRQGPRGKDTERQRGTPRQRETPRRDEPLDSSRDTNLYRSAGLDPDQVETFSKERQAEIVIATLKRRFGFKFVHKGRTRDLAAFVSWGRETFVAMANMANALGLPRKAMSLDGVIGLTYREDGTSLGSLITRRFNEFLLPRLTIETQQRSDSFAHEYGHALDAMLAGVTPKVFAEHLFASAAMAENPRAQLKGKRTHLALVHLFHAMYGKNATNAFNVMQKIKSLNRLQPGPFYDKRVLEIKADMSAFLANAFFEDTDRGNIPSYYADPREMLARAFEQYVAQRMAAVGMDPRGVGVGKQLLVDHADPGFDILYPGGVERVAIYDAFEELILAIKREHLFAKGKKGSQVLPDDPLAYSELIIDDLTADAPDNHVAAIRQYLRKTFKEQAVSQLPESREAAREDLKAQRERGNQQTSWPEVARSFRFMFRSFTAITNRDALYLLRAHPRNEQLPQIFAMFFRAPGTNLNQPQHYNEAVVQRSRQFESKFWQILDAEGRIKLGRVMLTQEDNDVLLDTLAGLRTDEGKTKLSPSMRRMAAGVRRLHDDVRQYGRDANVEIGFRDNHVSRFYDELRIQAVRNQAPFLRDAASVYEADRNYHLEMMPGIILQLQEQLQSTMPRHVKVRENAEADLADARATLARYEALDPDEAAVDWLASIRTPSLHGVTPLAPAADFTKTRKLGPAADKFLRHWMDRDLVSVMQRYSMDVVRRAEYTRRAGVGGKRLEDLKAAARHPSNPDPIDAQEALLVDDAIAVSLGSKMAGISPAGRAALSHAISFTLISKLGRSVFAGLMDTSLLGAQSGDLRDSLSAMGKTIKQLSVGMSFDQKEEAYRQINYAIGLSAQNTINGTAAAQAGAQDLRMSPGSAQTNAVFFTVTGQNWINEAQQTGAMQVWHNILVRYAVQYKAGDNKRVIEQNLRDAGLSKPEMGSFLRWVAKHPDLTDIGVNRFENRQDAQAQRLARVLLRLTGLSVMDPTRVDKPRAAQSKLGTLFFSITSHAYAFMQNVMLRQIEIQRSSLKEQGTLNYAALQPFAVGFMGYLALQTFVQAARLALFDNDRFEEKLEEEGVMFFIKRGATYSGVVPPMTDRLYNAYTGAKYNRGFTAAALGPAFGSLVDPLEAVTKGMTRNSPNTGTTEFNAGHELYRSVLFPLAFTALERLQHTGGPVTELGKRAALGVGAMWGTASTVSRPTTELLSFGLLEDPRNK